MIPCKCTECRIDHFDVFLLSGIGLGMVIITFLCSVYYNVIMAWTFYYLFASFQKHLPWESCDKSWNSKLCQYVLSLSCVMHVSEFRLRGSHINFSWLSCGSSILAIWRCLGFVEGGKPEKPEKNLRRKARSNYRLDPYLILFHVRTAFSRTVVTHRQNIQKGTMPCRSLPGLLCF